MKTMEVVICIVYSIHFVEPHGPSLMSDVLDRDNRESQEKSLCQSTRYKINIHRVNGKNTNVIKENGVQCMCDVNRIRGKHKTIYIKITQTKCA